MRTRVALVAVVVVIAALACTLTGGSLPPVVDDVGTRVAATLTAMAPGSTSEPHGPTPEVTEAGPTAPPPSVLRIVYVSGGNVWVLTEGSPAVQITSSGSAERALISSDGLKVAYTRRTSLEMPAELYSINADGTSNMLLLSAAQVDGLHPLGMFVHNDIYNADFVPGSHRLAFNTRGVLEGPGLPKYDDLFTIDTDSAALTTLFPAGAGGDFAFSPNGAYVVVVRPTTIGLANADGSGMTPDLVTHTAVMTYSEFMWYATPVWRADSSGFGLIIPSFDPLAPGATGTLWRVAAPAGPAVSTATITGGFYFSKFDSSLSPDLSRVAFLRETGTPNVQNLILANANGSGETIYATGQMGWLGWSPDDVHFVFSEGAGNNLRLGALGASPVALATGTRLRWISSTDFIYLAGSPALWTLTRGSIGGGSTALATLSGDFPSFDFDN